ncbi:MAG: CAP domain-containing protein [Pyrinomonadaceae bacterium]
MKFVVLANTSVGGIMLRVQLFVLRLTLFAALLGSLVAFNRLVSLKGGQSAFRIDSEESKSVVFSTTLSGEAKTIFQKVNAERKAKGLSALRWHEDLAKVAYKYSRKMAREGFFSHYDSDGNSVVERAEDEGIKNWTKIGENLFTSEGFLDPETIAVEGWMKSKSHRKNILDKEWTDTGVGVYQTGENEFYVTQVFIRKSGR